MFSRIGAQTRYHVTDGWGLTFPGTKVNGYLLTWRWRVSLWQFRFSRSKWSVPSEMQEDGGVIFGTWLRISNKGMGHRFLYHYVLYRIVAQLERNGTLRALLMNHSSYTEIMVHYKYTEGYLT